MDPLPISINLNTNPPASRPVHQPPPRPARESRPKFHRDQYIPGMELDDYTKRHASEDGTFVHVIQHKEWIEKIKQPPTPEEIAERKQREEEARVQKRKDDAFAAKVAAGIGSLIVAGVAVVAYFDAKKAQALTESDDANK